MISPYDDKQGDIIDAFNTTSSSLDDIININNVYLTIWKVKYTHKSSNLINLIPIILKPRFGWHLSISNDIVSTKFTINVTISFMPTKYLCVLIHI